MKTCVELKYMEVGWGTNLSRDTGTAGNHYRPLFYHLLWSTQLYSMVHTVANKITQLHKVTNLHRVTNLHIVAVVHSCIVKGHQSSGLPKSLPDILMCPWDCAWIRFINSFSFVFVLTQCACVWCLRYVQCLCTGHLVYLCECVILMRNLPCGTP